jgi:hypothetical protein
MACSRGLRPAFPPPLAFSSDHDLPAIVMGCPWLAIRAQMSEVGKHVVAALRVGSATIGFEDREGDQGHTHIRVVLRRPGGPLAVPGPHRCWCSSPASGSRDCRPATWAATSTTTGWRNASGRAKLPGVELPGGI